MPIINIAEQEKTFQYYSLLPREIQSMIIGEMEVRDRCRFSRCSKISNQQVKESKNYIYELQFQTDDTMSFIKVRYGDGNKEDGYVMLFEQEDANKQIEYKNLKNEELCSTQLDDSTDITQDALEKFKNLLKTHQNQVKKLVIYFTSGYQPTRFEFPINNLPNLEIIKTDNENVVHQLMSKTRKPLKSLTLLENGNNEVLEICQQIYEVKNQLAATHMKLNNEQFLRLSAKVLMIHIGDLTEQDIYNFVRSWQNDTIGKVMECCRWILDGSNFDLALFFTLFGVDYDGSDSVRHEIKHNNPERTSAHISFDVENGGKSILSFVDFQFLRMRREEGQDIDSEEDEDEEEDMEEDSDSEDEEEIMVIDDSDDDDVVVLN